VAPLSKLPAQLLGACACFALAATTGCGCVTADQVEAKVRGSEPVDTAARQSMACKVLKGIFTETTPGGFGGGLDEADRKRMSSKPSTFAWPAARASPAPSLARREDTRSLVARRTLVAWSPPNTRTRSIGSEGPIASELERGARGPASQLAARSVPNSDAEGFAEL